MIRFKFDWTILIIIYLKFRFKIYGIDLLKIPKSTLSLKNTYFICVIFYIKQLVNFCTKFPKLNTIKKILVLQQDNVNKKLSSAVDKVKIIFKYFYNYN